MTLNLISQSKEWLTRNISELGKGQITYLWGKPEASQLHTTMQHQSFCFADGQGSSAMEGILPYRHSYQLCPRIVWSGTGGTGQSQVRESVKSQSTACP